MGSSNSTNTNTSTNTNNNPAPVAISNNPPPAQEPSNHPSISLVSGGSIESIIDEPVTFSQTFEVVSEVESNGGGEGTDVLLTLWKPTISEDLIKEDDHAVYVLGSAHINLDPNKRKKKKVQGCSCFCCRRRRRRRRQYSNGVYNASSSENVDAVSDGDGDGDGDEFTNAEVISLRFTDEIVIIPSEVFPLEMVAALDITPSELKEVRAKPKRKRRTQVPEKPDKPMSLWSLIKSAIGKDITKFPLPVNFAEPLSMLQRLAEDYEYSAILDKASRMSDSLEQLAHVTAFTISSYASTAVRTAKPFNPLLGETYEFDRMEDLGWRCIAEQVCHHPPIAALHCESTQWVQWQQFTMKSHFRGTYLEIHPLGVAHLRFKTSDNHYTWHKVTTIVRNLYMGKIYIEQEGEMDIVNHTTSEWSHLKFSTGGYFSRDRTVTWKVYNSKSEPKWEINGVWDDKITATRLDAGGKPISGDTRILWQNTPLPQDAEKHYGFSVFAAQLNEKEEGVAPTDARNRTDQRLMENAQWDEANLEKQRLEDRQRDIRKQRVIDGNKKLSTVSNLNPKNTKSGNNAKNNPVSGPEDGVEPFYTPCWFGRQRDPISGQYLYMFNGDYWNCKESQDWQRCPSLYDKK